MNLTHRWLAQLDALRDKQRLRKLEVATGIDFSSNDYLGYAKLPYRGPTATLSRSGSASRLLRGDHDVWAEVESALARWHGAEAALVMTSGYTANQGLLATIVEEGDWVASDALNHASIIDGLRLSRATRHIYPHRDIDKLSDSLRRAAASARPTAATFIVTESLFSMDGDVAPLRELVALAQRHQAHLIVDEAHATGCFGPRGAGLADALGLRSELLATVHTGGKALGVPGAYICCSALLKQILINRSRHFIFTTALPPLVGAWWLEALERVQADDAGRQSLHANAALFRQALVAHGVHTNADHYIVPIMLGSDERAVAASARLQTAGFDIRAIRPPTVPEGQARLRIAIHADHDAETLQRAAAAVAEAVA